MLTNVHLFLTDQNTYTGTNKKFGKNRKCKLFFIYINQLVDNYGRGGIKRGDSSRGKQR